MENVESLSKLEELEKWFNTLLPTIVDAKKALEAGISMKSNRVAIDKEHKAALSELLSDKEKLKGIKNEIVSCEGKLKTRIEADNISFKDRNTKNKQNMIVKKEEEEKRFKSKHEDNEKILNGQSSKIKGNNAIIDGQEVKIAKLESSYKETKRLALAEN